MQTGINRRLNSQTDLSRVPLNRRRGTRNSRGRKTVLGNVQIFGLLGSFVVMLCIGIFIGSYIGGRETGENRSLRGFDASNSSGVDSLEMDDDGMYTQNKLKKLKKMERESTGIDNIVKNILEHSNRNESMQNDDEIDRNEGMQNDDEIDRNEGMQHDYEIDRNEGMQNDDEIDRNEEIDTDDRINVGHSTDISSTDADDGHIIDSNNLSNKEGRDEGDPMLSKLLPRSIDERNFNSNERGS